jgi:3-phosphoshikimate 1-carboxyvinyltransferase
VWVPKLRRGASLQGDLGLLSVLEQMGCVVEDGADSVRVTGPERLRGVCVDMGDISDTVMTLACVAPYADGPTTMERIGHIRLKESDRIMAVADGLQRMGIQSEIGEDFLRVFPGEPRGAVIETFDDHRIAMAFSIMGLVTPGVGISDPECVAKTCPEFYDLLSELY